MPACSSAPLVNMETIKFDDWSLELGPHLTGPKAHRVRALFACIGVVLPLASKTSKATKTKPIDIQLEDDHPIF